MGERAVRFSVSIKLGRLRRLRRESASPRRGALGPGVSVEIEDIHWDIPGCRMFTVYGEG